MVSELVYAYAYFVVYCFLGWICESTYVSIPKGHFVNRGFLYGPYIPIYGFGAMIALYPLIGFYNQPILVFLLSMLLTSILEYFTSWAMEKMFHTLWWDYSKKKFNINGRVCLLNSTLFGIMCTLLVYVIHPITTDLLDAIPYNVLVIFLIVYSIVFFTDMFFTVRELLRRKQVIDRMKEEMDRIREEFEHDQQVRKERLTQQLQELEANTKTRLAEFEEQRKALSSTSPKFVELSDKIEAFQARNAESVQNLRAELAAASEKSKEQLAKIAQKSTHADAIKELSASMREHSATHLSRAFPNRKVEDSIQELVDVSKIIEEEMKRRNLK